MPDQCDGVSLLPWLAGETPAEWRQAAHWEYDFRDTERPGLQADLGVATEAANLAAIRTDDASYVHFAGLPPLLFDHNEQRNLADDPAHRALAAEMANALLSWRMRSGDRRLSRRFVGAVSSG